MQGIMSQRWDNFDFNLLFSNCVWTLNDFYIQSPSLMPFGLVMHQHETSLFVTVYKWKSLFFSDGLFSPAVYTQGWLERMLFRFLYGSQSESVVTSVEHRLD